ncbi:ATP-grasp fold amidoligase family protein [Massilimicrobiota timonensis]|uniref:ATP-grasp fold amidoligase family protein n=1 Tax=Massilimicrobiota timonensis TaxID=1776392 RepID=UPI001E185FD6|nr:ATP-grasp fold amidoligase family protein [Massilimicrobiota timonensis]MBM6966298.1 carbonic anhydrase [Massilimicrobiota timonensis]
MRNDLYWYKKYIKSASVRSKVLKILTFVPDEIMLKIQYGIKLGRKLNIKKPQRYTEKLQWYKIHYKNPIMHQCVDKYEVREFVKSKGLEKILVPLIKKYNSVDEINWDELPNKFVLKTTHGGGGLNVIICTDKNKLNIKDVYDKLKDGNKPFKNRSGGREWAYYGLKPGIVVEELLINEDNPEAGINDYKIFCYNGSPKYIIVDVDRYINHKRNFYDLDWNNLNIESDCSTSNTELPKPENFDEMMTIASKLSQDFPYVRVDLYNISGKIYFGELTFYPWSGYVQFNPDVWDFEFGKYFKLDKYEGGE